MTEPNGKSQPVKQFHRLVLRDVKKDRLDGLLTAKGAIFYTVIASHKPGTPIRVNPKKLAAELSISRTSFYDAIAKLKLEGRIDFEAEGDLILRIPIDKKTGVPQYLSSEELSTIPDSQSTIPDSQSTIPDSQSTIPDKKSSKPSPSISSSDPSDIQILQISRYKEREIAWEEEENDDIAFRNWLLNKANSLPQKPALMEQWIDKEMLKGANRREFAQYQATRVATPIPAILPQENLSPQEYWAKVSERGGNGNG